MKASIRTVSSIALLAALVGYFVVSLQFDDGVGAARVLRRHPALPPFVLYRALSPREAYGRVALLPLRPGAAPEMSQLACTRLHYAGGRGLCATQEMVQSQLTNVVYLFDRSLLPGRRVTLDGAPTRMRVSPNGRLGAVTTSGDGESAAEARPASRTRIINMRSGQWVADLRDFRVENFQLPPVHGPVDVGGVAFERDGDRFFATLATEAMPYLVAGSVSERRLSTIRTGVTNEALSPDGRRLAVKRWVGDRGVWQLAVIDLDTWTEHDLPQGALAVDDQVEWLDDEHVIYPDVAGGGTSLWMLPIDGATAPTLLLRDADSATNQH